MLYLILLITFLHFVSTFPAPSLPLTDDSCSVKNWICNIKCPGQQIGQRKVCGIEELSQGAWKPSQATLQSSNNFCLRAQIVNDFSHLAVGNFFQSSSDLAWSQSLDCLSIRLGDEKRRQRITFDLAPPIHENPRGAELVIFERANGTRDGLLDSRLDSWIPTDSFLPEAFAFSLLVDGTWTKFFYSGVNASFVQFRNQIVPDWKDQDQGYNVEYDSYSTEIEFQKLGISSKSVLSGISIMNLQPGDMVLGQQGDFGEVVFKEDVQNVCNMNGKQCTIPQTIKSNKAFGEYDYDPDIVWVGPFAGHVAKRKLI